MGIDELVLGGMDEMQAQIMSSMVSAKSKKTMPFRYEYIPIGCSSFAGRGGHPPAKHLLELTLSGRVVTSRRLDFHMLELTPRLRHFDENKELAAREAVAMCDGRFRGGSLT